MENFKIDLKESEVIKGFLTSRFLYNQQNKEKLPLAVSENVIAQIFDLFKSNIKTYNQCNSNNHIDLSVPYENKFEKISKIVDICDYDEKYNIYYCSNLRGVSTLADQIITNTENADIGNLSNIIRIMNNNISITDVLFDETINGNIDQEEELNNINSFYDYIKNNAINQLGVACVINNDDAVSNQENKLNDLLMVCSKTIDFDITSDSGTYYLS